eukprot:PhF_6_TR39823/c0_g1_i1/m.59217
MPVPPGIAVTVLPDCPHTPQVHLAPSQVVDIGAPCATCGNAGENWMCCTCGVTLCGRHVNGHMVEHNTTTGHPIACGFMDISFWCYTCEQYLSPQCPALRGYHRALELSKFGETS